MIKVIALAAETGVKNNRVRIQDENRLLIPFQAVPNLG
jgi:hypothetical protein